RDYVSPGSENMRAMLEKAKISRTGPEPDASVKIIATGVLQPADSFTLTWSVVNRRPEKLEIRTKLDGKPVSAMVEYASLPAGLFYAAHTVISAPKKDLVIDIDTFDYARSGGAR